MKWSYYENYWTRCYAGLPIIFVGIRFVLYLCVSLSVSIFPCLYNESETNQCHNTKCVIAGILYWKEDRIHKTGSILFLGWIDYKISESRRCQFVRLPVHVYVDVRIQLFIFEHIHSRIPPNDLSKRQKIRWGGRSIF